MIDEIGYETELQGGELSLVEYDGGILKVTDISFGKSTDLLLNSEYKGKKSHPVVR